MTDLRDSLRNEEDWTESRKKERARHAVREAVSDRHHISLICSRETAGGHVLLMLTTEERERERESSDTLMVLPDRRRRDHG